MSLAGYGQGVGGSVPRAAENRLLRRPSLFSPFDRSGKLVIAEWKLWVLKNKKALLKVQVFLKARGAEEAVEKNVCLTLTVLHNVHCPRREG